MPIARRAECRRLSAGPLVLALSVALTCAVLRPGGAIAQHATGKPRQAVAGGVARSIPSPPTRPGSGGVGVDGRPRSSAGPRARERPVARLYGRQVIRPIKHVAGERRSVHTRVSRLHAFVYTAAKHRLIGSEWGKVFPSALAYYPNYRLKAAGRATTPSVYYYYAGALPAYISTYDVINQPPQTSFVVYPIEAVETASAGLAGTSRALQTHTANSTPASAPDPRLASAVVDIETAWNQGDIRLLSRHVRLGAPLAVYQQGRYLYSLDADSYLSMTRDALSVTTTVGFTLDDVRQRGPAIYSVSGHHTYADLRGEGATHTVQVCFVLQRVNDTYYILQVGYAPGRDVDTGTAGQVSQPQAVAGHTLAAAGIHTYPEEASSRMYRQSGQEWDEYFTARSTSFPHYFLSYTSGITTYSPYYNFEGAFPPYIGVASVINRRPLHDYVHFPAAVSARNSPGTHDANRAVDGTDTDNLQTGDGDTLLANAIADLDTAWNQRDIRYFSRHVHRDIPIAIYLKGGYAYSLDGGDYLRMTRDALAARTAVSFTLDRVRNEGRGAYSVTGHQSYVGKGGVVRTVESIYVLRLLDDDYYLIQVGTEPIGNGK